MHAYLDFERPIADLEGKIVELRQLGEHDPSMRIDDEVARLQAKAQQLITDAYARLTPWQKAQVARHPGRPHFSDYAASLIDEFTPLAGDRLYGEDRAVIAGLGRFRGQAVAVVGQEKGNDTKSRLAHNFGMAMPEGYRKAQRLLELADRYRLPVLSFADTQGAYPGVGAEERGQAEAIARSTQECLAVRVPFVSVIIGEGMSGGALGIAVANRVYMLEHSIYSVISPEGCASILWKSSERAPEAAEALGLTAHRLKALGLIDKIVNEPVGGAHRDPQAMAAALKRALGESLRQFQGIKPADLVRQRYERLCAFGRFQDIKSAG